MKRHRLLVPLALMLACGVGSHALRAGGDPANGKAIFEQCAACHSLKAGRNETGPTLNGIFGRRTAALEGFVYSPAMKRANQTWTPELLDKYLADPQAAPFRGNRMPFPGLADAGQREDLIAYLIAASKP